MNKKTILSPFIEDCLNKYPTLELDDNSFVQTADEAQFIHWLEQQTAHLDTGSDPQSFSQRLAELRHCVWAKLAFLEINHLLPTEQGVQQLNHFAKACLMHIGHYCFMTLSERFGVPYSKVDNDPQSQYYPMLWSILCMGKLGGDELNFSSDIDIIFCYDDISNESSLAEYSTLQEEQICSLSTHEFYQRMIKSIASVLNQNDTIFRLDMRLRPFGQSGAMACSYDYLRNYLQNHARDWERLAYAKANVMSADKKLQKKFEHLIQPFVYRQYTDYGVLQSIRDMRDKIASTLQDKRYENDIKVGFGGIRLLEFSLQSLQFTLYIKHPDLKVRGAFNFLHMLKKHQAIALEEQALFHQYLIFLRRLEHRLQIWQDKQTHMLPDESDEKQWQWLADTMLCNSTIALKEKINSTRRGVNQIFAKVLPDYPIKSYEVFEHVEEYNLDQLTTWLERVIGENPPALFGNFIICLQELLNSRNWRQATQQAQNRFSQLLPQLAKIILSNSSNVEYTDNPTTQPIVLAIEQHDAVDWNNLFRLLSSILQRSAYLSLLCEYPQVRVRILLWCQQQPWLIQQVIDYPVLLESIISPQNWYTEIQRNYLRRQLHSLVFNPKITYERKLNQLREFKNEAVFKVAGLNKNQELDTYKVSDCLTNIARQIIPAALQIATQELYPNWSEKIAMNWDDLPILYVGYGKLGSYELGYSSDLDMVILYDDTQLNASAHLPFFFRLVRKMTDILSLYTVTGKCYEVDYRLRPDGDKGMLIVGIRQYREYLLNRAWIWEKQSLIKARSIAGHRGLSEQFIQIRKEVLSIAQEDAVLNTEIANMRDKMRKELDRSNSTEFHLKQGVGGMIDIEFISQYWAMKLIPIYPALLRSRSVSSLLMNLSQYKECPVDTKNLVDIYLHYRSLVHELALDHKHSIVDNDWLQKERQLVSLEWQKTFNHSRG